MSDTKASRQLILEKLGIDLAQLKDLDLQKRVHYRAVANWLTKYKAKDCDRALEIAASLSIALAEECKEFKQQLMKFTK